MSTDQIVLAPEPEIEAFTRTLSASLPRSVAIDVDHGSTAVIAGTGDWVARIGSGAAPIAIVVDPQPTDAQAVRTLAADASEVVLSETFAGNPAVAQLRERAADALGSATLMTLVATGDVSPATALLEQLRLLRAVGVTEITVSDSQVTSGSALVTASGVGLGGSTALLRLQTATTTAGARAHRLRIFSPGAIVSATLPSSDTARPATVSVMDGSGALHLPDISEHAHRATLRDLTDRRARDLSEELTQLADDLELIASITA